MFLGILLIVILYWSGIGSFTEKEDVLFGITRLQNREIMGLLQLCLEATSFVYNDVQYKQLSGLPMGSPISVVLSEITMQHLEKRSVSHQPVRPLFWFRYIDDCIYIDALPSSSVNYFLNHLNSQPRSIQFTCKQQQDNQINFLDIDNWNQTRSVLVFFGI